VKFAWIDAQKAAFDVRRMCKCLRVSSSGYYAWSKRPESQHAIVDTRLRVEIRALFAKNRGYYGSPRIHDDLRDLGIFTSRKRVIRLMQEEELVARVRRRYRWSKNVEQRQSVAPNLLGRNFEPAQLNESWAGDVTELRTGSGTLFLAVVLDLFSRSVIGWALSAANDRHLAMRALDLALRRRRPGSGLLHHSDQGSPYTSDDYQELLKLHGITCSMSRKGNCYDNAVVESFFATFKAELGERFASHADAKHEVFDYIEVFYNRQRKHSSLGYVSPAEYERRQLAA
jgi:putative transposase